MTANHYERISKAVAELPLRRDYPNEIPPTPADLDFTKLPLNAAAIHALLPARLASAFEEELQTTPIQHLTDLAMEWGTAAVSLHSPGVQHSLELVADDKWEELSAGASPAPSWYEQDPSPIQKEK